MDYRAKVTTDKRRTKYGIIDTDCDVLSHISIPPLQKKVTRIPKFEVNKCPLIIKWNFKNKIMIFKQKGDNSLDMNYAAAGLL